MENRGNASRCKEPDGPRREVLLDVVRNQQEEIARLNRHSEFVLELYYDMEEQLVQQSREILDLHQQLALCVCQQDSEREEPRPESSSGDQQYFERVESRDEHAEYWRTIQHERSVNGRLKRHHTFSGEFFQRVWRNGTIHDSDQRRFQYRGGTPAASSDRMRRSLPLCFYSTADQDPEFYSGVPISDAETSAKADILVVADRPSTSPFDQLTNGGLLEDEEMPEFESVCSTTRHSSPGQSEDEDTLVDDVDDDVVPHVTVRGNERGKGDTNKRSRSFQQSNPARAGKDFPSNPPAPVITGNLLKFRAKPCTLNNDILTTESTIGFVRSKSGCATCVARPATSEPAFQNHIKRPYGTAIRPEVENPTLQCGGPAMLTKSAKFGRLGASLGRFVLPDKPGVDARLSLSSAQNFQTCHANSVRGSSPSLINKDVSMPEAARPSPARPTALSYTDDICGPLVQDKKSTYLSPTFSSAAKSRWANEGKASETRSHTSLGQTSDVHTRFSPCPPDSPRKTSNEARYRRILSRSMHNLRVQ